MNALGIIARGLAAGAIGTAAMDTLLFRRYRRAGGESRFPSWEFSAGLTSWEGAPAPALVGKRIFERLSGRELGPDRVPLVNNVMHWGYGMLNGTQYGVVARSLRVPPIRYGLPFGATVFSGDYVVLSALKLYEPIWKYDRKTLADDLSAHLVYGLGTAAALQVLSRGEPSCH